MEHFLKISDSYQGAKVLSVDRYVPAAFVMPEKDLLLAESHPAAVNHAFTDTSPPPSGRKILIRIHQLKLAPELG